MMTKKDYIKAANIVQAIQTGKNKALCAWQVREAFVVFFSGDNPKFNTERFRIACGEIAESYDGFKPGFVAVR